MAGATGTSSVELRQQGEEIESMISNLDVSLGDLNKDNKRWLIIGIVINTVMSPALRGFVKTKIDQLYQTLNNSNSIGSQQYPNQMQFHLGTFLNYEAINNNKAFGRQQQKRFDYNVKDSVDLSKLFLETNMAKYSAIDESCDLSALLGIVIKSGICPANATQIARKLRDDVRNSWAHCIFSEWKETKYTDSFGLMEQLAKDVGFPTQEENNLIANLTKWKSKGKDFIEDKTTEVLAEVTKEIRDLIKSAEVVAVDTPEEMCKLKEELVKAETMLLNHANRIQQLEKATSEHSVKIDALKESIPSHMRAQHKIHIDEWKKDEGMFTYTRATKHVVELIEANDVVVVTGSSGSGKSTIIHHVALQLQKKFEVVPFILSPVDIIRYRDVNRNQLFVIDDLCGKNIINENELGNWKNHMEKILKLLSSETGNKQRQEGKLKILVTCRLQIFKNEKMKRLKMFTKQVVDLHSKTYCLTQDEKKKMIEKYTTQTLSITDLQKVEEMSKNCTFFPILCKMLAGKHVDKVYDLFSSPIESIKNDIKDMIQTQTFEFCALVLCVLFPDGFHEKFVNPTRTYKSVQQKITKIVSNFKINLEIELDRKKLTDTFNLLNGTYIKKTGRKFSISHDMLYDMVSVNCAEELVELFIEFAPSTFIAEKCRFLSVFTDIEHDESFVNVPVDTEQIYFDRVFEDLKKNDMNSLVYNRQLKEPKYREKIMRYLMQNTASCKQVFIKLEREGIKQKCNYKNSSEYRTTPIIEATKAGFYELIKFLIQCKCDVNIVHKYGRAFDQGKPHGPTPLYIACERGHTDIVKFLLDSNVDASQTVWNGIRPLYAACEGGHTDIVKLLLDRNVDVSQTGRFGETPLSIACKGGNIDIVKLLLDRNVDVSQTGRFGETPLYDACERGHTEIVQLLLDRYVDVSQTDEIGRTPLYAACAGGHIDIVQILLDRNVDVSQTDRFGLTPLYAACEGGNIDIVKLLLDRNVDVPQLNVVSWTPLYAACERGHTDIVQLLLDRNVDVSQTDRFGKSSLSAACEGGNIDIVKLLLDRNVDVSQTGRFKETALYAACNEGHTDIVQLLLDRYVDVDVSYIGSRGRTPIHVACAKGHTDIVQLLLDRNADVSNLDAFGMTPLLTACNKGHTDIVQLLLDRKVDVSQTCRHGQTLLFNACIRGHTDIVKLLLDKNVDVSDTDRLFRNPLHIACEGGYTDIVQLLLDRNVDVSQLDIDGWTPMYVACMGGHTDIVQLLLEKNMDCLQPRRDGHILLLTACKGGYMDIVELLLESNVDVAQPYLCRQDLLFAACKGGHTDVVQLLIDRNVDVSQTDEIGRTPLYAACAGGHIDIVQLLLDRNVDVSKTGMFGWTPLYAACKRGHTDIVQLLLDRNIDVSRSCQYGEIPLHAACERGHTEIVQLLLDRNVDVSQTSCSGQTPLYAACVKGHIDIVHLLLDKNVHVDLSRKNSQGQCLLDVTTDEIQNILLCYVRNLS